MDDVLFETWGRIGALVTALVVSYLWLVATLRVSGKRTLAKLNAFDFVVTIALGSALSTVILSRDVPVVEGLLAMAGLVLLQYLVARTSVRWTRLRQTLTSEPTALLVAGAVREEAMAKTRVTPDELAAAIRKSGIGSLTEIDAVVFETDGSFSVVPDVGDASALRDVLGISELSDLRRR
jgi:uncharacterized membrane protein YcaP (DUF421 family)